MLRKLAFYRDFSLLRRAAATTRVIEDEEEEESKRIMTMDIQQYLNLTKMELKSQFLIYAEEIVIDNKPCLD